MNLSPDIYNKVNDVNDADNCHNIITISNALRYPHQIIFLGNKGNELHSTVRGGIMIMTNLRKNWTKHLTDPRTKVI